LVRLAFHDATGNGGPNGCIDFTHTQDNNGLQDVVATLDTMYEANGLASVISKADLYVLAANVAISYATTPAPNANRNNQQLPQQLDPPPYTLNLPFRYGRVDAASCNDAGFLPAPDFSWSQIFGLFGGRFGMSVRETVAIMGAHSLGRCKFADSGFDGGWTASQSSFSNVYYQGFSGVTWNNNNRSTVWLNGPQANVMLMADVELLFNSHLNGQGTCNTFNSLNPTARCPLQAQASAAFTLYARSISAWFTDFSTAWQKMTEYLNVDILVDVGVAPTNPLYPTSTDDDDVVVTSAPTRTPTLAPTAARSPTAVPTRNPTQSPTLRTPTYAPTSATYPTAPTYGGHGGHNGDGDNGNDGHDGNDGNDGNNGNHGNNGDNDNEGNNNHRGGWSTPKMGLGLSVGVLLFAYGGMFFFTQSNEVGNDENANSQQARVAGSSNCGSDSAMTVEMVEANSVAVSAGQNAAV
jgi:cytochrome c peroxidase